MIRTVKILYRLVNLELTANRSRDRKTIERSGTIHLYFLPLKKYPFLKGPLIEMKL